MRTPALGRRVTILTLAVLALAFVGCSVAVTLSYRDGLIGDLRGHLTSGAQALQRIVPSQVKSYIDSLHLEGIQVNVADAPVAAKPGAPAVTPDKGGYVRTEGSLLVLHEPLAGGRLQATLSASAANVGASVNRLIVIELIAAAITLAAAALVLAYGLRAALAPLGHVGGVAAQVAAGERLLRLRPRDPSSELGRMAASFDAMIDALDAAVQQARASEQLMRRFVADASHELRSPIAALQASAETLLREQPPRPLRDALEAQLAREAARLGRLADDLLSLARIEASDPARQDPVDLAAIAGGTVAEAGERAHTASLSVCAHGDASVLGDADALARALRNLVDNALTATGMTGNVGVEVDRVNGSVRVQVSDDGPGIPPSERERIFDGFVRLDRGRSTGAGLGLAIARRVARQHKGDLTCDDCPTGARFTLVLPAVGREATQT